MANVIENDVFMSSYILSIDQGTTSSRAIVFTKEGNVAGVAQQEFPQHFPNDGWVEHDPNDILQSVLSTCKQVLVDNELSASDIAAIGITNQRETTIVWDKTTGKAICNAIVWQDRRTNDYCKSIESPSLNALINEKTGLLLDPYFSATKIRWILENIAGAKEKAENGDLLFGTIDTFLLWHLTDGKSHKTDASNASRTMLFNIREQCWDKELLALFSIPASLLPEVMDSSAQFGLTEKSIFGDAIPICGIAGDQQAALIGQACFKKGMAKSTYGTGCFLMLNTGDEILSSQNKLLSTVAYRLNGKVTYAIEGSIFMAGATMQWIRDGLQLISHAKESEALANQIPYEHGVVLVPAFTGLGAPYWDADARGAILGLTRDSGIKEVVSAALQSVAYQTKDLLLAMESDGLSPQVLRVDGGMVQNDWLLTFLSGLLGISVQRPKVSETTALGVAYLAGLAVGVFESTEQLAQMWHCEKTYQNTLDEKLTNNLYSQWLQAVSKVQS